jgi:microcystin synthetase protein McyJ
VYKACEQLIEKLILFSGIKNGDSILDVGFGYGDQSIYLAKKLDEIMIHGINNIESQVKIAKRKVKEAELESRVWLEQGNANLINKLNEKYDTIFCIESAFHFETREQFLRYSFDKLIEGGKIVLADLIFARNSKGSERLKVMGVASCNNYSLEKYLELLESIGFRNIQFEDISEKVIPFAAIESSQSTGWRTTPQISLPKNQQEWNEITDWYKNTTKIDKYIIVKAER